MQKSVRVNLTVLGTALLHPYCASDAMQAAAKAKIQQIDNFILIRTISS